MKKEELEILLRSVGVDENTVMAMGNAYDIGYEHGRHDAFQSHMNLFKKSGEQDEPKANQ
jgi:hypothetical protein